MPQFKNNKCMSISLVTLRLRKMTSLLGDASPWRILSRSVIGARIGGHDYGKIVQYVMFISIANESGTCQVLGVHKV